MAAMKKHDLDVNDKGEVVKYIRSLGTNQQTSNYLTKAMTQRAEAERQLEQSDRVKIGEPDAIAGQATSIAGALKAIESRISDIGSAGDDRGGNFIAHGLNHIASRIDSLNQFIRDPSDKNRRDLGQTAAEIAGLVAAKWGAGAILARFSPSTMALMGSATALSGSAAALDGAAAALARSSVVSGLGGPGGYASKVAGGAGAAGFAESAVGAGAIPVAGVVAGEASATGGGIAAGIVAAYALTIAGMTAIALKAMPDHGAVGHKDYAGRAADVFGYTPTSADEYQRIIAQTYGSSSKPIVDGSSYRDDAYGPDMKLGRATGPSEDAGQLAGQQATIDKLEDEINDIRAKFKNSPEAVQRGALGNRERLLDTARSGFDAGSTDPSDAFRGPHAGTPDLSPMGTPIADAFKGAGDGITKAAE
jgi:hypothetical protein